MKMFITTGNNGLKSCLDKKKKKKRSKLFIKLFGTALNIAFFRFQGWLNLRAVLFFKESASASETLCLRVGKKFSLIFTIGI